MSRFLAESNVPICLLDAKAHFEALSTQEKFYAHHIAQATWAGSKIILDQTSSVSAPLFDVILGVFRGDASGVSLKSASGVSEEEWSQFVDFVVVVLGNMGNYRSFGDTKIIPRLSEESFAKIAKASDNPSAFATYEAIKSDIFAADPSGQLLLGFPVPDGHVSGYYTPNMSKAEIDFVQAELDVNGISALNTRLFKKDAAHYIVAVASALKSADKVIGKDGKTITVTYGDFAEQMRKAADACKAAVPYAANEHQKKMLEAYVSSFETGSIEDHVESQRHWIKDVGPVVETNVGFIETYQDPAGVRAAWEGFVSCVNKEQTAKFNELVNHAPEFIPKLPWGAAFEKDKFNRPDFTSLEVLTFATSGLPAGNIPNYDNIRMAEGFKNVSLGNVLSASAPNEKITFVRDEDLDLYKKLRGVAFEVQVGLHELLGHGTGKLLSEEAPGKFNFDNNNPPIHPFTGSPVTTWYKPGETWSSVFKGVSNSYEECRAECVAIYLCPFKEIVELFLHGLEADADDVVYVAWLSMARAGLLALEFYDPATKKHGQAHMQGRFAILRVMLAAGQDFVKIERTADDDLRIHLDRTKIRSVGLPAVGEFLKKLQVYKSIADAETGTAMYNEITAVPHELLALRDIVLARKQPRKVFVQANTLIQDGNVVLKDYPATAEGLIQSWLDRQF
ncbi:peptidase family M49-domain-containing protein [Cladochytrium replicatum]|nr:peptidase family M49-domain-containing protein [Cladochytrium replicatum]